MDIRFVSTDDWTVMYADDKIIMEGHSLQYRDILDWLKISYKTEYINGDVVEDKLNCTFPATYTELHEKLYGVYVYGGDIYVGSPTPDDFPCEICGKEHANLMLFAEGKEVHFIHKECVKYYSNNPIKE